MKKEPLIYMYTRYINYTLLIMMTYKYYLMELRSKVLNGRTKDVIIEKKSYIYM